MEDLVGGEVPETSGDMLTTIFSMILATIIFLLFWFCKKDTDKRTSQEKSNAGVTACVKDKSSSKESDVVKKTHVIEKEESAIEETIITDKQEKGVIQEHSEENSSTNISVTVHTEVVTAPDGKSQTETVVEEITTITTTEEISSQITVKPGEEFSNTSKLVEDMKAMDEDKDIQVDGGEVYQEDKREETIIIEKETDVIIVKEKEDVVIQEETLKDLVLYEVYVKTGSKSGAGTDSNVYIVIFGDKGDTGKIILEKGKSKKTFEKNHEDLFTLELCDVGDITSLRIGHDNAGGFAGWYLEMVTIDIPSKNCKIVFHANRWLDKNEGDGKLEVDLLPFKETESDVVVFEIDNITDEITTAGEPEAESQSPEVSVEITTVVEVETKSQPPQVEIKDIEDVIHVDVTADLHDEDETYVTGLDEDEVSVPDVPDVPELVLYEVNVKTGSKSGAGTDANVYIVIFGDQGDTGKIILEKGKKSKKTFEKNHEDLFTLELCDVGDITNLRIGHDNAGGFAGWYLEMVTIDIPSKNCKIVFHANRWLDKHEGDGKLEVDLLPFTIPNKEAESDVVVFEIDNIADEVTTVVEPETKSLPPQVQIEDIEDVIHIDVTADLHDEDESYLASLDAEVSVPGVPEIKQVCDEITTVVEPETESQSPQVEIEDIEDVIQVDVIADVHDEDESYFARLDAEVSVPDIPKIMQVDCEDTINVDISGDLHDEDESYLASLENDIVVPDVPEWKVNVEDTDSVNASADLHNEDESSLANLEIEISVPDVPEVKDQDVCDPVDAEHVDKRKSSSSDDSRSANGERAKESGTDDSSYDSDDSGEKDNVMELFKQFDKDGDGRITMEEFLGKLKKEKKKKKKKQKKEKKEKKRLEKEKKAAAEAEAGKLQVGDSLGDQVQTMTSINRSREDISMIGGDDGVKIYHETEVKKVVKVQTIEVKVEDEDLLPVETDLLLYEVSVKTGDKGGAGTDSNVYIVIFGDKGDTGKINLETPRGKSSKTFERNCEDMFMIEACDVGKITSLRIGHDDAGSFAGWYLENVVIDVPSQNYKLTFQADRWLDTKEGDGKLVVDLQPTRQDESDMVCEMPVEIPGHHHHGAPVVEVSAGVETAPSQGGHSQTTEVTTTSYTIDVKTGDVRYAGTDANVFVVLYGELGSTAKLYLGKHQSSTHKDAFERDHVDKFNVDASNVGNLVKIRIGHDNHGGFAGWYVDEVVVYNALYETNWSFPVNRWLDKNKGDGKIEVEVNLC